LGVDYGFRKEFVHKAYVFERRMVEGGEKGENYLSTIPIKK